MTQQQKVGYALCVIGGLVIGFFAGVQYVQYRMVTAFADAAHAFADGLSGKSKAAAQGNDAEPAVDKFKGLTIDGAKIGESLPGVGPALEVIIRNNGDHIVTRAVFECEVKSPGRAVAWATCHDARATISGGLEPGEWRAVEARGLSGLYSAAEALKERKGAQLTVRLTDVELVERP